jgi:iron complex outermembrane receptor protein
MHRHRARVLDGRAAATCTAIAVLATTPVAAQTPVPPTVTQSVIVTATASPVPAESASRAMTVLTREDLLAFGLTSFADALRLAAGVDPRARGPRGVQTDIAIRGATFGQSLVLVDGLRINDSQSGHHNGEIPMSLLGLDRIEVAGGPASAVHGADALGGVVHVITRRDAHALGSLSAGQFGYVAGEVSLSGVGIPSTWLLTGWGARSGGFTATRDFAQGGLAVRGAPARGLTVDLRHQRRGFGAAGFYGPSPSREWTDQTLAAATLRAVAAGWVTDLRGSFRNHGDHFRWDVNRPGFAENRHRTNATEVHLTAHRDFGSGRRVTLGSGGGRDWIRSSNLGRHEYQRVNAFAEAQLPVRSRGLLQAGLRFDGYSTFGRAWSPTVSASGWVSDALRLRASAGRAFRVPTFTELYYRDPAHEAGGDLTPETGWSIDGGADWTVAGWTLSASPFIRWDRNVIDWVKDRPEDLWRTTNVRDVTTRGLEATAVRRIGRAVVRVAATALDVDAPALTRLSKYVLEYARRSAAVSVAAPIGRGFRLATTIDYRNRADGQSYALVGARVSRTWGRVDVFGDATNLFDTAYAEIPGVAMPGRWVTVGVTIR